MIKYVVLYVIRQYVKLVIVKYSLLFIISENQSFHPIKYIKKRIVIVRNFFLSFS